jgi:ATP synthase protein I
MPFNRFNPGSKPHNGLSGGIGGLIEAEKLLQVAFVLPSAVLIGWAAGWWLGHALHQKWIEIAGVVFGCVSGLVYVIQMAVLAEKKTSLGDEGQNGSGKGTPGL